MISKEKIATTGVFPFWALSLLFLLPWIIIQLSTSVNSDVAWLSICAQRLLEGGTLSGSCFDTNPPLNVLIYAPPLMIAKATGLAQYYSLYIFAFAFILLSAFAVSRILSYMDFIDRHARMLFVSGFLVSVTILPTIAYAERDHFIALGLLPFILAQLALTWKISIPRKTLLPVLVLGGLAILIKPHFGLLPTLILFHRMIIQKRLFSIMKDADFIVLSVMSSAYIVLVSLFFSDFLTVILPDVLNFYLHYNNPGVVYPRLMKYGFFLLACLTVALFLPHDEENDKRLKRFLLFLVFGAAICLLVYMIQMKGFYYHLLPLLSFAVPALCVGIYKGIQMVLKPRTPGTVFMGTLITALFLSSYIFKPLLPDYPTHEDYKNAPLTQYIGKECAQPCSFFITHENMDIISQIAYYTGYGYATRFPSYWFVPAFKSLTSIPEHVRNSPAYKEDLREAHARYAAYVVEDLKRYNPSLLLIMQNPPHIPEEYAFHYFDFFANNPEFQEISGSFIKTGTFSTDRSYFFRDTKYDYEYILSWDVYKSIEAGTEQN